MADSDKVESSRLPGGQSSSSSPERVVGNHGYADGWDNDGTFRYYGEGQHG